MRVFYELDGQTKVYTVSPTGVRSKTRYTSFVDTIQLFTRSATRQDILLLAERHFSYFSFVCHVETTEPFTRQDEQRFVQDKLSYITAYHHQSSWCVQYEISHVTVDGRPQRHVLGHTGVISFSLNIALLDSSVDYLLRGFRQRMGSGKLHIYPRSFFTRLYLMQYIQRENYFLLVLGDAGTQLFQIERGWYKQIEYINWGVKHLKKLYREHGLEQQFYKSHDGSYFAGATVGEIHRLFLRHLLQWVKQYVPSQTDMVAMGRLMQHRGCIDALSESYTREFGGFLLPFHHAARMRSLPGYAWRPDELHVACCCTFRLRR